MAARCLVQYEEPDSEKVRRVMLFNNDGEDRVAKCLVFFQLQGNFALEALDTEFGEYVRVNDSDLIDNGCKLLLVPLKSKMAVCAEWQRREHEEQLSTASTIPVLDLTPSSTEEPCFLQPPNQGQPVTECGERAVSAAGSANHSADGSSEDVASPRGAQQPCGALKDRTGGSAGDVRNAWLNPETLTRRLRIRLEEGSRLEQSDYSQLMDALYEGFITSAGGDLPTKAQYDGMVGSLVDSFPKIRGKLTVVDVMTMLKRMLRDKFRNKRAACRKRTHSPLDSASRPTNKPKRVAGMPNYQPDDTIGDVELMIKINEMKTANAEETRRLMHETFGGRRRMIVEEGATSSSLAQDFPALFTPQGFRDEVDRLTGKTDYMKSAVDKFDRELEGMAATLKSPEGQVLPQVAKLLGVQLEDVLQEDDGGDNQERPSPYPTVKGSKIVVDGLCLTTVDDQSEAVVSLVLAHSVCNLNFQKKVAPLMFFVQRYMLFIDDGRKAPQKCLKLVRQLGK